MHDELLRILSGASHWALTFNEHRNCYQTVAGHISGLRDAGFDDDELSEAEAAECIRLDQIWDLHVYPTTPVGFHKFIAPTFEALMVKVRRAYDGEA